MPQSREEHLAFCKQRALEYLDRGDVTNAYASMSSDLRKHPETAPQHNLMILGFDFAAKGDVPGMRRFIEGFR